MDFNTPLWRFIHFVLLLLVKQYSKSSWVRGSANIIFISKIYSPKTVTQCWIPPIKSVNWIIVVNVDISRNVYYQYCSSNTLYDSLHRGFSLLYNMIQLHVNIRLKREFFFKQSYNLIFKMVCCKFVTNKEKVTGQQIEQPISLNILKIYKLGSPGTDFLNYTNLCTAWREFKRTFFRLIK